MLIDAHTHIEEKDIEKGLPAYLNNSKILSLACASEPDKCKKIIKLAEANKYIVPTIGLHPWQAGIYNIEDLMPFLEKTEIIGEIGLDSIWCDVPLCLQIEAFEKQLDIAQKRKCPVVLHTKGEEKRIVKIIKNYSMPKLVHWYSCEESLEDYIKLDCYFTVGPDVDINPAVKEVASKVPLNRIFVETDGVSALEWVLSKNVIFDDIEISLNNTMKFISEIKKTSIASVENAMEENLTQFLCIDL